MILRTKAGGSVATGRSSHARQVKGNDLDKKGYPGALGCGLGVGLATPSRENVLLRIFKNWKPDEDNFGGG